MFIVRHMKKNTSLRTIIIVIAAAVFGITGIIAIVMAVQNQKTTSTNKVDIVAGTNVWCNIAEQVGGEHVNVTSVLSDPEADPHLFESDAKTASTIAGAELVIVNGLGYDEFMDKLLDASTATDRSVLNVSEVLKAGEVQKHALEAVVRLAAGVGLISAHDARPLLAAHGTGA